MARHTYNRSSVDSTLRAAAKASTTATPLYVFAVHGGLTIAKCPPPFGQKHYEVRGDAATAQMVMPLGY